MNDWRDKLRGYVANLDQQEKAASDARESALRAWNAAKKDAIRPAFEELKAELEESGHNVKLSAASITVHRGSRPFCRLRYERTPHGARPIFEAAAEEPGRKVRFEGAPPPPPPPPLAKADVIEDFLKEYAAAMRGQTS